MPEKLYGLELFWTAPPGVMIVAMKPYRDIIIVVTNEGVYQIKDKGRIGLDEHEVQKMLLEPPTPTTGS